jgi:deoxyadenosine/deoxycytidine kinase
MPADLIAIVGPCAAGKSTLIAGLKPLGYNVRHVAQEHSYSPSMWQRITKPDVLIYLEVSYENSMKRRAQRWSEAEYLEEVRRLSHARQHADLFIDTNPLSPQEVLAEAVSFLDKRGINRILDIPIE